MIKDTYYYLEEVVPVTGNILLKKGETKIGYIASCYIEKARKGFRIGKQVEVRLEAFPQSNEFRTYS